MVQRKLDGLSPSRPSQKPASAAGAPQAKPAPAARPKPAAYQADSLTLQSSVGAAPQAGSPPPPAPVDEKTSDARPVNNQTRQGGGSDAPVGPTDAAKAPAGTATKSEAPALSPAAQALAATDAFFVSTTSLGNDTSGLTSRRLERDLYESSESGSYLNRKAEPILKAQAPLIEQRMAQLTEEQRQQVKALRQLIEKEPLADLALNALLLREPSPLLNGPDKQTLLGALARTASSATPLAETIDRGELVGQLIRETAYPTGITQSSWGTCTVSTLQILMAMKDPVEYIRLVTGLASPDGRVTMRNGDTIVRSPGSEKPIEKKLTGDYAGEIKIPDYRSLTTRLWAVALMEYGNGPDVTYDYVKDEHSNTQKSGLGVDKVNQILEALTQRNTELLYKSSSDMGKLEGRIQEALAQDVPVPMALEWGGKDDAGKVHLAHMVLITRKDNERTYYANPWGKEESISEADFQARLLSVQVPEQKEKQDKKQSPR